VIVSQAAHAPAADNVVVEVRLMGEIDVTSVPSLSRYLRRILGRSPNGVVFDLAGVRFLDCAAARTIVGAGRMLCDGQRPVLRHPRPVVRRLLSVTGLEARCVVEPVDAAFSGQRWDGRR
jgi:anti-anti-sigma factor